MSLIERRSKASDRFKFVDFDIEGSALADIVTNRRRNRVLAQLQRNNPDVLLSFTLPVMPSGLTDIGLNMLQDAQSAGVRIDAVNIMVGTLFDTFVTL